MFGDPEVWLPIAFAGLMGLSILVYVVLDGYDLGVGMLLADANDHDKDRMVASIGPFWDANETWLVLAVGLLLVAFPLAHGIILSTLYLPVAVMLVGLILRGVAFEFRAKVRPEQKTLWNRLFFAGSLATALAQGFMLGIYIMGLEFSPLALAFAGLTAVCLAAGYAFLGACWLIIKTDGGLQRQAVDWARRALVFVGLGLTSVSLASPAVSPRIFDKWFVLPDLLVLAPLPIGAAVTIALVWRVLARMPYRSDQWSLSPFFGAVTLFALGFAGLAYSFFPYVVPEKLTIFEAASAPDSLMIIFVGTVCVVPIILSYSAFSYRIFRGKATRLRYD
jgi:cytochrome d ubiquinol oxidase subunit II